MRVELYINGQINIQLTPENDIEKVVLGGMLSAAEKGKTVSMSGIPTANQNSTTVIVSVEK